MVMSQAATRDKTPSRSVTSPRAEGPPNRLKPPLAFGSSRAACLLLLISLALRSYCHPHSSDNNHRILVLLPVASAMRIVAQRVKRASVRVDGDTVSSIGPGIMALVGIHHHDTEADLDHCCRRLLAAKLWPNESGGMWRHGVKQKGLELLCVSQFTLYGTLSKKNQPDYKRAMKALPAEVMYQKFLNLLAENYEKDKIFDGKFGAMMDVELVNDGPVTIIIESDPTPGRMEDSENGETNGGK